MNWNNNILINLSIIIVVLLVGFSNCKKDEDNNDNPSETVTNIDGNIYKTITIGDQVWMADNLRTTRYQNGDKIPTVPLNNSWASPTSGACCSYQSNSSYLYTYGRLYN